MKALFLVCTLLAMSEMEAAPDGSELLEKVIRQVQPFRNIRLSYTVEEQDAHGNWRLIERHRVVHDLAGHRQMDTAILRLWPRAAPTGVYPGSNWSLSGDAFYHDLPGEIPAMYRVLAWNGRRLISLDRKGTCPENLTTMLQWQLRGDQATITAMEPSRDEPYLDLYRDWHGAPFAEKLAVQARAGKIRLTAEAKNPQRMEFHYGPLRFVIDRDSGGILEKAMEVISEENPGQTEDMKDLVVLKSMWIDGRRIPVLFTRRDGLGYSRYRVDPQSVKLDTELKDEEFDQPLPWGCSVTDMRVSPAREYHFSGLDAPRMECGGGS